MIRERANKTGISEKRGPPALLSEEQAGPLAHASPGRRQEPRGQLARNWGTTRNPLVNEAFPAHLTDNFGLDPPLDRG